MTKSSVFNVVQFDVGPNVSIIGILIGVLVSFPVKVVSASHDL